MSRESEGQVQAEAFRTEQGLGQGPVGDLITLVEQAQGVDVAVLQAGPDEHGMTMRDPVRSAVVIAVARTRRPMRQRSTLAHELGHVLFGDYARAHGRDWSERSAEEVRADAFARHLLVPIQGLRDVLGPHRPLQLADLSGLVQRFLASPQVLAIQLEKAHYIDAERKQEWMAQTTPALAARFGWMDQYHALQTESDTRRAPQRLLTRATQGYIEGVVALEAIARLRGAAEDRVEQDFVEAGITPAEPEVTWQQFGGGRGGKRTLDDDDFSDLDALDTPQATASPTSTEAVDAEAT